MSNKQWKPLKQVIETGVSCDIEYLNTVSQKIHRYKWNGYGIEGISNISIDKAEEKIWRKADKLVNEEIISILNDTETKNINIRYGKDFEYSVTIHMPKLPLTTKCAESIVNKAKELYRLIQES